jgi:hypothetical protein
MPPPPSPDKDFKDQVSICSSSKRSSRNHYKALLKEDKCDFADSQRTSKESTANSKYGIIQHIKTTYWLFQKIHYYPLEIRKCSLRLW